MFVLDASVALAGLLRQARAVFAFEIIGRIADETAIVPSHWALELANALAREVRRGVLNISMAGELAREASAWPVIEDEETFGTSLGRILDLAIARRLSAYDAAYLELCLRRGLSLATFDGQLAKVASSQGVPLVIGTIL